MTTYTLEQLDALQSEFLRTLSDDYPDEWYETPRQMHKRGSEAFLVWLDHKESGVPYLYRIGQVINSARCADGVVRSEGKIINRRKTITDPYPCYLIEYGGVPYHVEERDIY